MLLEQLKFKKCSILNYHTCSGVARGERGERTLPLKKEKSSGKKIVGVKNLKTLKGGSLSVSVNSEPTVA